MSDSDDEKLKAEVDGIMDSIRNILNEIEKVHPSVKNDETPEKKADTFKE